MSKSKKLPKKKTSAKKLKAKPAPKMQKKPVAKKAAVKKPVAKKIIKAATKLTAKMVTKPVARPIQEALPRPEIAPAKPALVKNAAPIAASRKPLFKVGSYVVYPTHGVGRIQAEESQKIGDYELKVFVISFEKDKMTLRVPVHRAEAAGLRNVSSSDEIEKVMSTLKGRARTARGMWSRRAQEYEAKINSGNLQQIAEVVRDLHKNVDQSERSYSERMIYETALGRLVGEVAAAHKTDYKTATDRLLQVLRRQAA